jgi:hypothetical protein
VAEGGRRVGFGELLIALFGESERKRQRARAESGVAEEEEARATPPPTKEGTTFSMRMGGKGGGGGQVDLWDENEGEEWWDIEDMGIFT